MLYRTEGIVIRSRDYGESNKITTLLTPTLGKVGVVIRRARKPTSRFRNLAQLFTLGNFSFYRNGSLGTLMTGEVLNSFAILSEDLFLSASASYAAELTDRVVHEQETAAFLFSQLKACYIALTQLKDAEIVIRAYEMKVIFVAGYMPELTSCVNCKKEERIMGLSLSAGGVLCQQCRHLDPKALELENTTWRMLRLLANLDLQQLGQINVKKPAKKQLEFILRKWIDYYFSFPLKSRNFLDQVGKL